MIQFVTALDLIDIPVHRCIARISHSLLNRCNLDKVIHKKERQLLTRHAQTRVMFYT